MEDGLLELPRAAGMAGSADEAASRGFHAEVEPAEKCGHGAEHEVEDEEEEEEAECRVCRGEAVR
jgi:hypothetical protein